ncbi:inorganic phosphate transporter [Jiangella muralis]|uniref:inorganic phosphate transporter n=1 Tax=Jiangella muralis TaxID=702383 RepID=UPI0009F886D3|nr:inorganic phosphate transporter [Jiangella muralis]
MPDLMIAVAVVFALVTGANDGGALMAPGLRIPGMPVAAGLGLLVAAVVAVPLLVTTAVAQTLAGSIVPADPAPLAIGFVVAIVVAGGLARRGLPTSLTLAVIGGVAGAGVGAGLAVEWPAVLRVLAIGLAAPVAGLLLALAGAAAWRAARSARYLATVRRTHVTAYLAQCVAYGANDGQKAFVLFIAASVAAGGEAAPQWWAYPVVGGLFAIGAVIGLPRVARTVGTGIISTRAPQAVTAEFASAAAVLGSAAAGAPVSMTQALTGGLLGAGVHDSYRRVRWRVVANLGLAWAVTLPAAFALAGAAALVVHALTS